MPGRRTQTAACVDFCSPFAPLSLGTPLVLRAAGRQDTSSGYRPADLGRVSRSQRTLRVTRGLGIESALHLDSAHSRRTVSPTRRQALSFQPSRWRRRTRSRFLANTRPIPTGVPVTPHGRRWNDPSAISNPGTGPLLRESPAVQQRPGPDGRSHPLTGRRPYNLTFRTARVPPQLAAPVNLIPHARMWA